MKERQLQKSKNIFAYVLTMVRKGHDFSFPSFIINAFKLGAWKRKTRHKSEWVKERQSQKSKNILFAL